MDYDVNHTHGQVTAIPNCKDARNTSSARKIAIRDVLRFNNSENVGFFFLMCIGRNPQPHIQETSVMYKEASIPTVMAVEQASGNVFPANEDVGKLLLLS